METESKRLHNAHNINLVGTIWYNPATDVLWEVHRVISLRSTAENTYIEIRAFEYTIEGRITDMRRAEALPHLVERYLYFGTIRN